jgi:hypothetical protein
MCERHQGKRSASRAGINQGITFFSQRRKGAETIFRDFRVFRGQKIEVSGKGVSVETAVEMSVETPLKTLGETPLKTPLKRKVETTQETREKTREKILGLVCTSANISTDEMATQLGVTRKGIEWHTRKLKAENLLRRIGPDKGGHWEVLK